MNRFDCRDQGTHRVVVGRRHFLLVGVSTSLGLLAACAAPSPVAPTTPPAAATPAAPSPAPSTSATVLAQPTASVATAVPATLAPSIASPVASPAAPAQSGKVTYIQGPLLGSTFDASAGADGGTLFTYWPMFDSLTLIDAQGAIHPSLARSWKNLDDKTWEFALGDYKFHNGRPVEAQDVVDTYGRIRDPSNKLGAISALSTMDQVTAVDAKTVRVTTKVPHPTLPNVLGFVLILPMKELNAQGAPAFFKQPIGTGAFRPTQIDFKKTVTYTAMGPDWVTPQGVPSIKDIAFVFVPEAATQAAALRTGEADVIPNPAADIVEGSVKAGMKLRLRKGGAPVHFALGLNAPPLSDVRVRQAINYAVDKEAILKAFFGGYGALDGQLLGSNCLGYNADVKPYPYDPAKAKQLLQDTGASAVSVPLITTGSGFQRQEIGEAVSGYLSAVGIKTQQQNVDAGPWTDAYLGPPEKRPGLFASGAAFTQTFEPDSIWKWFSSDVAVASGRRFVDDKFDKMYQAAKGNFDRTKRGQLYQQAAVYLHDQAPVLFMFIPDAPELARPGIEYTPGFAANMFAGVRRTA